MTTRAKILSNRSFKEKLYLILFLIEIFLLFLILSHRNTNILNVKIKLFAHEHFTQFKYDVQTFI